jgi:hypothetical protein
VFTYQVTSDPPFGDSIGSRALAAFPSGSGLSVSDRSDPTDDTFEFAVATAEPVVINLGGINYRITTVSTTYDASAALLMRNPWWGDSDLATTAANLVGTSIGLPNSNPPFADIGPVFTYQVTSDPPFGDSIGSRALAAFPSGSGLSVSDRSDPTDDTFEFAVATPEPLRITSFVRVSATHYQITWEPFINATIQFSPSLQPGSWQDLESVLAADSWILRAPEGNNLQGFFRMREN